MAFTAAPRRAAQILPPFRTFHHIPDALPPATYINTPSHPLIPLPRISDASKQIHRSRRNQHKIQSKIKGEMEGRVFGLETPLMTALQHLLDIPDGESGGGAGGDKAAGGPTRAYVRDAHAMAATPADVKELPGAYAFVVDMPGLGSGDIKVQVEDERVLVISGERRREEKEGAKYLRMERRMGKFMRKFVLPENADMDKISAVCRDGVLTVTVDKLPPPEPKKPKTIEVKVA